jgi:hypothetical protein
MATRYRDLQRPSILESGIVDNSGAETAARLSQAFGAVQDTAFTLGAGFRAEQGQAEGDAAGAAGKPELRTGYRAQTPYGRAYNSAAEVSYVNQQQLAIEEQLDRIEIESEADPVGYQAKAEGAIKGLLENAPAQMRTRIAQLAQSRVLAGSQRVGVQFREKAKAEGRASYLEAAPVALAGTLKALKDLPPEQADAEMERAVTANRDLLDGLVASKALDADVAEKWQQAFVADLDAGIAAQRVGSVVDGLMTAAEVNATTAASMVAKLYDDPNYSPEEKDAILTEFNARNNLLRSNRAAQYVEQSAALAQALARGEHGSKIESTARWLRNKNAMSPQEFESTMASSARNEKAAIGKASEMAAVAEILKRGDKLWPGNPDHKKGLDQLFETNAAQMQMERGDERWQQSAIALAQQTNILPPSAKEWANIKMLSNNPEQALVAAEFIRKSKEANPRAYLWNDEPGLQVFADTFLDNIEAGTHPKEAYDLARKNLEMPEGERKVREQQYAALVKKDPNSARLASNFEAEFDSELPLPTVAEAEYESLVKQYFIASGARDLNQARKLAAQDMKGLWGETSINGVREIAKYPVEHNGYDPAYVRADIANYLEENKIEVDPARVQLVPIGSTDRTRGAQWGLEVLDDDGNPETLLGPNNKAIAYQLPYAEDYKAIRDEVARGKIEKARARREKDAQAAAELQSMEEISYMRGMGPN